MSTSRNELTALVVRQTTLEARCVATASRELTEHLERGDHKLAGRAVGEMLTSALRLLEGGASMRDVRLLIDLGAARAARTVERVA